MTGQETAVIFARMVVGPLQTNCYFCGCPATGEVMLIDPADNADELLAFLEKNHYILRYIFLTHTHFDHVGAVAAVHRATAAPILAHQQERWMATSIPLQAAFLGFPRPASFKITHWLADQETLTVGRLEGRVIHTPGHTPGGACLLINNYLFSGDTLFYEAIGRTDLPRGSQAQLLHSIRSRLWPLPDDTQVFPGHGSMTTIGHEKRYNPFVSS